LKLICQALVKACPDLKLYALIVDERPEKVTDFKSSVNAQLKALSTDLRCK
jgi:transcription termination factor Rho